MKNNNTEKSVVKELEIEYQRLCNLQQFDEKNLDYNILEKHIQQLSTLSKISKSAITIYDMYQKKHVFTSFNSSELFDYDLKKIEEEDSAYFDLKIHPEDLPIIMQNGIACLRFFKDSIDRVSDYKFIREYRIFIRNQYMRVIEQMHVLEFDILGNIWLSLCVLDISPNQTPLYKAESQLWNFKTGEIIDFPKYNETTEKNTLSPREKQILRLVRDGLLSKEISTQLSISVHTVNTHRQRILEKLNVDNSMEAIQYASNWGLLD